VRRSGTLAVLLGGAAPAAAGSPLELGAALALATLVSEDLTCIAAGLLVAGGRLGFAAAALACFVGIFVGDLALVAVGRWLGRPAVARRPLRWLVTPAAVERSERWFARRGPAVVFASRFVPGSRLPLFLAAGVLRAPVLPLAAALAAAGAVWTPLLVGLSAATGGAVRRELELWSDRALPLAAIAAAIVLVVVRLLVPALSWRGRRLLVSRWRRLTRWEFWPLALFQLPVVLNVLRLGLRFRSPALFTAANPGIPAGGFVLESKSRILEAVGDAAAVPRFRRLSSAGSPGERAAAALAAHAEGGFGWPVVAKPDVGERGEGVAVIRSAEALAAWARRTPHEAILQAYVGGEEFGVFYARRPSEAAGRLLSITAKEFPAVLGDGRRTLEELVLADERAVCQARLHLDRLAARLDEVPAAGQRVALVEIGNHCRGTTFRDGRALATPELARRVDAIARSLPGFHFGRLDLRAPSAAHLRAGEGLEILEINGVTSEATHVYEPGASLFEAYRTLFAQWRLAFEIGRENAALGARPARVRELLGLLAERRRRAAAAAIAEAEPRAAAG
jgi:membrane protein DedA with SNARE-associated domain